MARRAQLLVANLLGPIVAQDRSNDARANHGDVAARFDETGFGDAASDQLAYTPDPAP